MGVESLSQQIPQAIGAIDVNVCRERLETSLLANAGLIPDKVTFDRKEVRLRTALL